jgi:hypothetical protein
MTSCSCVIAYRDSAFLFSNNAPSLKKFLNMLACRREPVLPSPPTVVLVKRDAEKG